MVFSISCFTNSFKTFLFISFSNKSLNNLTVANASPLALCLSAIGIPKDRINFPKLYDGWSGIKFCANSTVQMVLDVKS